MDTDKLYIALYHVAELRYLSKQLFEIDDSYLEEIENKLDARLNDELRVGSMKMSDQYNEYIEFADGSKLGFTFEYKLFKE